MEDKNICPYCGLYVDKTKKRHEYWNIDHIFPKALFKWTACPQSLINRACNRVVTHYNCNYSKGAKILTCKQLLNLHLDNKTKSNLFDLRSEIEPYIEEYKCLVSRLLTKQYNRCYNCRRRLHVNNLSLRRLSDKKSRCECNAILLCPKCNKIWAFSRKRESIEVRI